MIGSIRINHEYSLLQNSGYWFVGAGGGSCIVARSSPDSGQRRNREGLEPEIILVLPVGAFWHTQGYRLFAKEGTPVVATTQGLVVYTGVDSVGGNVVLVLGGKWRFHYYAHLQRIDAQAWRWVRAGDLLGTVGSSGNAKGKPPHLHYAIRTPYPQPWLYEAGVPQAWNKLFFVDPNRWLTEGL